MYLLLLLILIPVLCISITLYILTLTSFISTTNLDTITLTITIFINIIITYLLPKLLIKCFDDSILLLNRRSSFNLIHSYLSFMFITLFGISLVLNSIVSNLNVIYLIIGSVIIILFVFVTITQFFCVKVCIFTLEDIIEIKKRVHCLILKDENNNEYEVYVSNKDRFKISNKYECKYNKNTNRIQKIIKEIEG